MMRFAAAAMLLLGAPAMAQDIAAETVISHGHSLVGLWRVQMLTSVAAGFFSPLQWGPLGESFCRIAPLGDELAVSCSNRPGQGMVTVDDDRIHFAWGTMMLRMTLDGTLENADHFRGRAGIKVAGISYEHPAVSDAVRLAPPDRSKPDEGGKADLLRRILEQGLGAVPRDEKAMKWPEPPRLGAVIAITWLGQESKFEPPRFLEQPGFFSVYLVIFAQGERLCTLHQREDGLLDWFRCA